MKMRRALAALSLLAFAACSAPKPQGGPQKLTMPDRAVADLRASGQFVSCAQVPPTLRCRWIVRYAMHGSARFPFAAVPLIVGSPQNVSNDARFIVSALDTDQATVAARDGGGKPLPNASGLVMLPVVYRPLH